MMRANRRNGWGREVRHAGALMGALNNNEKGRHPRSVPLSFFPCHRGPLGHFRSAPRCSPPHSKHTHLRCPYKVMRAHVYKPPKAQGKHTVLFASGTLRAPSHPIAATHCLASRPLLAARNSCEEVSRAGKSYSRPARCWQPVGARLRGRRDSISARQPFWSRT